jgi:hypothetical protein
MEYGFKIHMFGYKLNPGDRFSCEINKFNLTLKQEGADFL